MIRGTVSYKNSQSVIDNRKKLPLSDPRKEVVFTLSKMDGEEISTYYQKHS